MRILRAGLLALGALMLFGLAAPVRAEDAKNKGLFVTPLRSYVTVKPNSTQHSTITVANITDDPITVDMSVEQFSVADYTYDYQFVQTREDWIRLSQTHFELQPDKSERLTVTVDTPKGARPGGHYFTLFATTHLHDNPSQVRAATILYVTVEGELRTSSVVNGTTMPRLSFGGDIDFKLDVSNTGNTHFFTYASGKLEGLSVNPQTPETTNLLLPGTKRIIGSTIRAPLLPGVYRAVYGYRTDDGQDIRRTSLIVYLPLWSLLIPIGIAWLIYAIRHYRKRRASA